MTNLTGHILSVRADRDQICLSVSCHEPVGSPCRVWYAEPDCWYETGLPHVEEDGREHRTEDKGECLWLVWMTNDGVEDLHDPTVSEPISDGMQIDLRWDGDTYLWRGAGSRS